VLDDRSLRDPRLVLGVGTERDRAARMTDGKCSVLVFVDRDVVPPQLSVRHRVFQDVEHSRVIQRQVLADLALLLEGTDVAQVLVGVQPPVGIEAVARWPGEPAGMVLLELREIGLARDDVTDPRV